MFQGFSDKTIDFMWGIRFNNEKTWFEAHKEEYLTHFYNPMRELGRQVFDEMKERHGDLGLVLKVSRIYRDARRLHGRGPYKDHLWLSMERPGGEEWTGRPVFWFELAPESWSYGLGYWCAGALTMAKFRARLDRDPKTFEKLARAFNKQDLFVLEGEEYKRPKGQTTPLLSPWYNRKGLLLSRECDNGGVLFTPELPQVLVDGYSFLLPYYRYFISLEGDPDPRDGQ